MSTSRADSNPSHFRRRAEDRLPVCFGSILQAHSYEPQLSDTIGKLSLDEAKHLIHELHVNKIELEIQNEEFRRSQEEIEAGRDRYQELYEFAPAGYIKLNSNGIIEHANLSLVKMLGIERQRLQKRPFAHFVIHEDQGILYQIRQLMLADDEKSHTFELRMKRFNARNFYARLEIAAIPSRYGKATSYSLIISDISQQKQAETKLKFASIAFDNTSDGILITDSQSNIISVNRAFTKTTGYDSDEVLGKNPRILSSGRQNQAFYNAMWQTIATDGYWQGEIWNRRKSGETYPEWLSISAVRNSNNIVTNYVAAFSDISTLKEHQHEIEHLAHHDTLTGLPNRLLLSARLDHSLQKAKRENSAIGILFLDLDNFKKINDTLGHAIGDEVLKQITNRWNSCIREEDTLARLGGDEFLIVLEDINHGSDVAMLATNILTSLSSPLEVEGHKLMVSSSIGICIFPQDGNDLLSLVKNADAAMYKAKTAGGDQYHFYSPELSNTVIQHIRLTADLQRAIEQDEFTLHFQAQYSLLDGQLVGAEALIRWQHPCYGLLMPNQFIPIIEQAKQIDQLSDWMLRKAAKQWKKWQKIGVEIDNIAINLSSQQINDESFTSRLKSILKESDCPAERIELEVTESFIMHDEKSCRHSLDGLKEMGVRIAIDNFGTGYSSFSHLKNLQVDKLKIDQSFINAIPGCKDSEEIILTITALGKSLNIAVLAVGVESEAQRRFLTTAGCDQIQGKLCGTPAPAIEFLSLVLLRGNRP